MGSVGEAHERIAGRRQKSDVNDELNALCADLYKMAEEKVGDSADTLSQFLSSAKEDVTNRESSSAYGCRDGAVTLWDVTDTLLGYDPVLESGPAEEDDRTYADENIRVEATLNGFHPPTADGGKKINVTFVPYPNTFEPVERVLPQKREDEVADHLRYPWRFRRELTDDLEWADPDFQEHTPGWTLDASYEMAGREIDVEASVVFPMSVEVPDTMHFHRVLEGQELQEEGEIYL